MFKKHLLIKLLFIFFLFYHTLLCISLVASFKNFSFFINLLPFSPKEFKTPAYTLFETFSSGPLGIVLTYFFYIYSICIFCGIFYFFVVFLRHIKSKYFLLLLAVAFLITMIFFLFPWVMLFITLVSSILGFILSLQLYFNHFNYLSKFIQKILTFVLNNAKFLPYCKYYALIFYEVEGLQFKFIIDFFFLSTLGYLTLTKIFIFCSTNNLSQYFSDFNYFLLILMMFLSLFLWLFRVSLLHSVLLVNSLQIRNLSLNHLLLIEGGNPIDNQLPSSPPQSSTSALSDYPKPKTSFGGFFNRQFQRNYYYYPARPWYYYSSNVVLGVCGIGIGCVGAYLGYQAILESRRQNDAWEHQNNIWERQNDLEALNQGVITKEEYFKRHPRG